MSNATLFLSRRWFLLIAGLLLVWGVHLAGIGTFPPFIDEMLHVQGAEQLISKGALYNSDLGRQFTLWWLWLLGAYQGGANVPIWMGRVSMLLALLPGLAALMATVRLLNPRRGWFASALIAPLYAFSAYHLFFGRMALADPLSASAVLLAVYYAARLTRRAQWSDAVCCGLCLFVALGAKISALPYLGVPIAAGVALFPKGRIWKAQVSWVALAFVVGFGAIAAFIVILRLFKQDFLSNSLSYALTNRGAAESARLFDFSRLLANARLTIEVWAAYWGWPFVALVGLSTLLALWRRRWYLFLCAFAPLLVIWMNQIQETRFLFTAAVLLLALLIDSLWELQDPHPSGKRLSDTQRALVLLTLVWGFTVGFRFWQIEGTTPEALTLPRIDRLQYVESDASGFGYDALIAALAPEQPTRIIGLLSDCNGFRYRSGWRDVVECPQLQPSGGNIPELTALLNDNQTAGVFAIIESIPYVPASAPGTIIAQIKRPGGKVTLTVVRLAG